MSYTSSRVWSWIIRSDPLQRAGVVAFLYQVLAKDVVDVEDPDDEAVGEGRREVDERTNIKERIGDGYEDDAVFLRHLVLESMWCVHTGNVRSDAFTSKMCVCARTHPSRLVRGVWLDAKSKNQDDCQIFPFSSR